MELDGFVELLLADVALRSSSCWSIWHVLTAGLEFDGMYSTLVGEGRERLPYPGADGIGDDLDGENRHLGYVQYCTYDSVH